MYLRSSVGHSYIAYGRGYLGSWLAVISTYSIEATVSLHQATTIPHVYLKNTGLSNYSRPESVPSIELRG